MNSEIWESFFKNFKYAIIGLVLGALFGLANGLGNPTAIISSSATGFIAGVFFSLLQAYEEVLSNQQKNHTAALQDCQKKHTAALQDCQKEHTDTLSTHRTELKDICKNLESAKNNLENSQRSYESKVDDLDRLINRHENKLTESYELLERAKNSLSHYSTIQNLLGSDKLERELINSFLDKVVNKPNYITRASSMDFYKLLILGLKKCTVWRGIHQGSIRNLGFSPLDEAGKIYFGILRDHKSAGRKRIIILSEEDQKDLKRKEIMQAFWEKNGEDVLSYWISEDHFYQFTHLDRSIEVHDCAVHNSKVLLHYHRNYHRISDPNVPEGLIMIDFAGSRSVVWRAVTTIFSELENPSCAIPFRQIKKEDIASLPND